MEDATLHLLVEYGPVGIVAVAAIFMVRHFIKVFDDLRGEEVKRTEVVMSMLQSNLTTMDAINKQAHATALVMQAIIADARELVADLRDVRREIAAKDKEK